MSLNDTARRLVERPLNPYDFVTIYCELPINQAADYVIV